MAAVADVPIVNMLSRPRPPAAGARRRADDGAGVRCRSPGATVAWVGDYNNVARSLGEVARCSGAHSRSACPAGFDADDAELERFTLLGAPSRRAVGGPAEAVAGADAVHTDTWVSMGQEEEKAARVQAFEGFTVDDAMMALAAPERRVHALPAGVPRARGRRPT